MECSYPGAPTPMGPLIMAGIKKGKIPVNEHLRAMKLSRLQRVKLANRKEKLKPQKKKYII